MPADMLRLEFADSVPARGPISPKRPLMERAGAADIFPYYAGFSFNFAVAELAEILHGKEHAVVLDPWNGGGTTTRAAQHLGLRSVGVDLNPVANVAAYLRCHTQSDFADVEAPLALASCNTSDLSSHPLSHWFSPESVARLSDWITYFASIGSESRASAHAGLLAVFRITRSLSKVFQGSNPTWVRRARSDEERVAVDGDVLDRLVTHEYRWIVSRLKTESGGVQRLATIVTGSADQLPVADDSITATFTSPPYLTRIDYAVAYARELAVLGIDIWKNAELRRRLMGTTLTRATKPDVDGISDSAAALLHDISTHESKASSNYYKNQAAQYIQDLCLGLDEITRVTRPSGTLTLVVQDSYYKDVPVRLADICTEEATRRGWTLEFARPFAVKRSLVDLNTNARAYTKAGVAESVIRLRLESDG